MMHPHEEYKHYEGCWPAMAQLIILISLVLSGIMYLIQHC